MAIQRRIAREANASLVGRELDVLVEGESDEHEFVMKGRHAGQAPRSTGRCFSRGERRAPGRCARVRISQASDYDLVGELLDGATRPPKTKPARVVAQGAPFARARGLGPPVPGPTASKAVTAIREGRRLGMRAAAARTEMQPSRVSRACSSLRRGRAPAPGVATGGGRRGGGDALPVGRDAGVHRAHNRSAALAALLTSSHGLACSDDDVAWLTGPRGVHGAILGAPRRSSERNAHGEPAGPVPRGHALSPEGNLIDWGRRGT